MSKYDSTKLFWKTQHKNSAYTDAENIEKNNKLSRDFIKRYISLIKNIKSLQELGVGSGRNINIFSEFLPKIEYFGNDLNPNLIKDVKKNYPNVEKICHLSIQDTLSYLDDIQPIDATFTHGHLMHLPDQVIDVVCKKISEKTNHSILLREAYINNPGAGLFRTWRYKKYRFDRDYSNRFPNFKLIDKIISNHPTKKWVRQCEYFFSKI